MDDAKITMEEYIELMAEKAQRRGQTFNWETATYGKVYCDKPDFFTDFKADFLAIVYNDVSISNQSVYSEPTEYTNIEPMKDVTLKEITPIEFNTNQKCIPLRIMEIQERITTINAKPKRCLREGKAEAKIKEDIQERSTSSTCLDFGGMPGIMVEGLTGRMLMEHQDDQGHRVFTSRSWRSLFEIRGPLVHELILEFFNT
ncbi:hypothetical protein Tco_0485417 [Tanacetum coccineum]